MNFDDLIVKYDKIHEYFRAKYPHINGDYEVLARLTKIAEEYGELVNETHYHLNLQRVEKQAKFDESNLEKEWADVFNTVMLFGKVAGIDMEKALKKRFEEIYSRYSLHDEKSKS